MIDRSKPLTEQTPADLRALLDALHGNREHYNRANRIVEARSCELEIAEATRALAIINRRATEAEEQRQAAAKLDPALCRQFVHDLRANKLGGDLVQWIDRRYLPNDDDTADRVAREIRDDIDGGRCEPLDTFEGPASAIADQLTAAAEMAADHERLTGYLTAQQQECAELRAAMEKSQAERWKLTDECATLRAQAVAHEACERPVLTADEVREAVREAFDIEVGSVPGSPEWGFKIAIAARVAEKLAGRTFDPVQRQADLREAYLAGALRAESACYVDQRGQDVGARIIPPSAHEITAAAAEYTRSKAGG